MAPANRQGRLMASRAPVAHVDAQRPVPSVGRATRMSAVCLYFLDMCKSTSGNLMSAQTAYYGAPVANLSPDVKLYSQVTHISHNL